MRREGAPWLLSWSSGHKPPRQVYYARTQTGWCASYDRALAHRFPSRAAALGQWLRLHAYPPDYEPFIRDGSVRAEADAQPELPLQSKVLHAA